MSFTHLHAHSTYSFLDGYGKPEQIAERVKNLQQTACALTDHGNVFGHVYHQKAMVKAGIKPLFGCEFYLVDDMTNRTRHNASAGIDGFPHLTILAETQKGYENMLMLSRLSYSEGFYYKPRIDWPTLAKYQEGLVVLSGCCGSYSSRLITAGKIDLAYDWIARGKEQVKNFFVELIPLPDLHLSTATVPLLMEMARDLSIPMVMTSDSHFPAPENWIVQDLMCAVGQGKKLSDASRVVKLPPYLYYCSEEELFTRGVATIGDAFTQQDISDLKVALHNTGVIAEACNVEIPKAKPIFFYGTKGVDSDNTLWKWIEIGIAKRYEKGQIPQELFTQYHERCAREFQVIKSKGFSDYILALTDIILWCKSQNRLVMCRGSAGGCLLLWALGASETDSIRHNLSFERFYDDTRSDPPDIDVDFEQSMRPKILEYIFEKYGEENCSQICALTQMKIRNSLLDVAFAYGINKNELAPLLVLLDSKNEDVQLQLENITSPAALALLKKYPQLYLASQMVGQCRQSSIHAAGLIISSENLSKVIGVCAQPNKPIVASVDKKGAEELGFLKMDLLSVTAFDVVAEAMRKIGLPMETLYNLPLGDKRDNDYYDSLSEEEQIMADGSGCADWPEVYQTVQKMKVAGIFQLDGSATRIAKLTGVDCFEDLYACSALCRPGASDFVNLYSSNKQNPADFEVYLNSRHPISREIIRPTYGVLLYQEQVMAICREMAGMDWPMVHKFRKRISLGNVTSQPLDKWYEEAFFEGCKKNGVDSEEISYWWEAIKQHGIYSFNKSHCVTYGIIGYWMLWIKTFYPSAYYEAFLNIKGEKGNELLVKRLIAEFREVGGTIQVIDLQRSKETFSVIDNKTLVGGWQNIKGIGPALSSVLVEHAPYDSWDEVETIMLAHRGKSVYQKIKESGITGHYAPDVAKIAELISWFPLIQTGDFEAAWRDQYALSRPGDYLSLDYSCNDVSIVGYITAIQKQHRTGAFRGEQTLYALEDETGSMVARVSAKNVDTLGSAIKNSVKQGDYVMMNGWFSGDGTLFVKNFYNLSEHVRLSKQ